MKCEKPEKIEYTLTITMTAEDWGKLREQLEESTLNTLYPNYNLRCNINDLLDQARKIYWPKSEWPER